MLRHRILRVIHTFAPEPPKRCYRAQNRNQLFDILDRYSISYGKEKGDIFIGRCPIVRVGYRSSNFLRVLSKMY